MREPALDSSIDTSFRRLQSSFVALTAEEELVAERLPQALEGGHLEEARELQVRLQAALTGATNLRVLYVGENPGLNKSATQMVINHLKNQHSLKDAVS